MKTTRCFTLCMLLMVTCVTIFSSCKKNVQIVGKWECTKDVLTGGDHYQEGYCVGQIWEFKTNGKVITNVEEMAYDYSIEGNRLIITDPVSFPECPLTAIIQSLTKSQLSLSVEYHNYEAEHLLYEPRDLEFKRL